MNIRQLVAATLLAFALAFIAGCGGSGSGTGSNPAAFAGIYAVDYSRAGGSILIEVRADGRIDVAVNDDTAGYFSGSGTIGDNNSFNVVCSGAGAATVTISGNLTGSGAGRTASGTVTGTFNVAYSAPFVAEPNHSVFAGNYVGTFSGGETGTWEALVSSSGQMTGRALSGSGEIAFDISGQISGTGSATVTGVVTTPNGDITTTYTGTFRLTPTNIVCSGSWSSSLGTTGSWEGVRVVLGD